MYLIQVEYRNNYEIFLREKKFHRFQWTSLIFYYYRYLILGKNVEEIVLCLSYFMLYT